MSADLAIVVPSKGRTPLLERMVRSAWRLAAEPVHVIVVLNHEDAVEYEDVIADLTNSALESYGVADITVVYADDAHAYPGKLNVGAAAASAAGYRYLALWNDDHEPLTDKWDRIAKDAIGAHPFGLAHGPDGVWEEGQVPTAPILTTSFFDTLGWVVLPGLFHIRADDVWRDLANWCGVNHFIPELRIQHHHLDNGEAEMDATYALTQNNDERNRSDNELFDAWWKDQRWIDGDKLMALWPSLDDVPARQFAPWE